MPGIIIKPDADEKLRILAESAKYDVCLAACNENALGGTGRLRSGESPYETWIYPASVPGKGTVSILKVLQTNVCEAKCSYCMLSVARDSVERVAFASEELASLFMSMVRKRLVEGIFISSGIGLGADRTMDSIVATARILRLKYFFTGYIHLKILPGCSLALIDEAARFADRISLNMEAPTTAHLARIAPYKDLKSDIMARMKYAGQVIRHGSRAKSQTTQLVVGASDESDTQIIKAVDWTYRELYLFRAYFSAYQNPHARMKENNLLLREHRLYQSDFLLRAYGWSMEDLVFDRNGNLPLATDPKTAFAMTHPELFPVDINKADIGTLLKVPGIGPVSAQRIVERRRESKLRGIADLRGTGAYVSRAEGYLLFSGRSSFDRRVEYVQQTLFDTDEDFASGWQTGILPYRSTHDPKDTSDPCSAPAIYPGQKGKRITYNNKYSPQSEEPLLL
jgi:predicted DNA-binding helix-hairpin-helix protein